VKDKKCLKSQSDENEGQGMLSNNQLVEGIGGNPQEK
jgi:hypothetical protein